MPDRKKLYIKTYGCQMNVYDSERMAGALAPDGYEQTSAPDQADLILLNTCHIREKAAEKIYSELGRLKGHKANNPDLKIGVTGCVAQAEGAFIMERQPAVDLVVGPQAYHNLPAMMKDVAQGNRPVNTDFPLEDKFEHLPKGATSRQRAPAAFLTVQEGCDKFCAFCVVPYTRGAEVSRPAMRIIDEAKALVDSGVRDITLLGQNVNAYHGDGPHGGYSLARLIAALAEIEGLARIRYTTSHPNDMSDDLIAAHGEIAKLMPYLHLPVQSGSNRVLKAMNRKHTAQDYIALIERIRSARPDLALSGDFIVGFPGETEEDFEATLDLCDKVQYAQAYSFKYSERPGTPASERAQVDEDVKSERLARLQAKLTAQQTDFQQKMVGRKLPVLLEKRGRDPGQLVGKSPYLHAVHVDADAANIGSVVDVKITQSGTNSLNAVVLD
jgi:tRNA-2-methylthio-N6-dimethylallyladenosine synthase